MALHTTGTIKHSQIMGEFGHTGQFKLSADGAPLINKSANTLIKESDFYGASASTAATSWVHNIFWQSDGFSNWGDPQAPIFNRRLNGGNGDPMPSQMTSDIYWPSADRAFDKPRDPEMPSTQNMNNWCYNFLNINDHLCNGSFNQSLTQTGMSGSASTGSTNNAEARARKSYGFPLQKMQPGTQRIKVNGYAWPGDGSSRFCLIRVKIRELDNPVPHGDGGALDRDFVKLSTRGTLHHLFDIYNVSSNGARDFHATINTTMPYLYMEVFAETSSYRASNYRVSSITINA